MTSYMNPHLEVLKCIKETMQVLVYDIQMSLDCFGLKLKFQVVKKSVSETLF